ncbi:hypothetical protein JTF19_17535 [Enterobacteriaceae bacterium RIT814]|nr:hypothetical protein [Enterobacteriaceae bacterium RIT 814]
MASLAEQPSGWPISLYVGIPTSARDTTLGVGTQVVINKIVQGNLKMTTIPNRIHISSAR